MATGAEAVRAIAEAADLLPATVDRAFRTLQVAKQGHVPIGKLGGGKSTPHMELHHLRYLVLGITAQPITSAAAWVDRLSNLRTYGIEKRASAQRDDPAVSVSSVPESADETAIFGDNDLLISSNFGRCLDRLIAQAAEQGGKRRTPRLAIEITVDDKFPRARLSLQGRDGFHYSADFMPSEAELLASGANDRIGAFTRTATLKSYMLHLAADLWSDTLAHQSPDHTHSSPGTTSPNVAPGDENAPPSRQGERARSAARSNETGVATPSRKTGSPNSSEPNLRECVCPTPRLTGRPLLPPSTQEKPHGHFAVERLHPNHAVLA